MPKINYDAIPYEKQYSTGEKAISHKFYDPDPDYSEDEETYKGYYTHDLFGLKIEDITAKKHEDFVDQYMLK